MYIYAYLVLVYVRKCVHICAPERKRLHATPPTYARSSTHMGTSDSYKGTSIRTQMCTYMCTCEETYVYLRGSGRTQRPLRAHATFMYIYMRTWKEYMYTYLYTYVYLRRNICVPERKRQHATPPTCARSSTTRATAAACLFAPQVI